MAAINGMGALLRDNEPAILKDWVASQMGATGRRNLMTRDEVQEQSRSFLALFSLAAQASYDEQLAGQPWDDVRASLASLSRSRAGAGYTPLETATFVFSLKNPIFSALRSAECQAASPVNA